MTSKHIYITDTKSDIDPILVVFYPDNLSLDNGICVLRTFKDGRLQTNVWLECISNLSLESVIERIREKYKLVTDLHGTPELDKAWDELNRDGLFRINLPTATASLLATSVPVDLWGECKVMGVNRPRTSNVEGFTFEQLKELWKAIGKGGYSNKSKTDLFEGFAETAVELAESDDGETFRKTLPSRMLVVGTQPHSGLDKVGIKQVLALASRISSGAVYDTDTTPDVSENTICEPKTFVDMADIYESGVEKLEYGSEAEAVEAMVKIMKPVG